MREWLGLWLYTTVLGFGWYECEGLEKASAGNDGEVAGCVRGGGGGAR